MMKWRARSRAALFGCALFRYRLLPLRNLHATFRRRHQLSHRIRGTQAPARVVTNATTNCSRVSCFPGFSGNCSNGNCDDSDDDDSKCPADSSLDPSDETCVCKNTHCNRPLCRPPSRIVLRRKGSNVPGDCCDVYQCVSQHGEFLTEFAATSRPS